MLPSQFILSVLILIIIYKTVVAYRKNKFSKQFTFLWVAFWVVILLAISQTWLLTKIANLIGIGRGVDLAIYISIIMLFYLIFRIYSALDSLNQKITRLIRKTALAGYKRK